MSAAIHCHCGATIEFHPSALTITCAHCLRVHDAQAIRERCTRYEATPAQLGLDRHQVARAICGPLHCGRFACVSSSECRCPCIECNGARGFNPPEPLTLKDAVKAVKGLRSKDVPSFEDEYGQVREFRGKGDPPSSKPVKSLARVLCEKVVKQAKGTRADFVYQREMMAKQDPKLASLIEDVSKAHDVLVAYAKTKIEAK